MRLHLLALALVAPSCYSKSDLLLPPGCAGDACATGESSGGGESTAASASTSTSTSTTTTTSTSTSTSGLDDGSSSESSTSSGDESSSTGEPADNMYAPCTSDDMCTSGMCIRGFCTQECWSQTNGETPCPSAPDGASGIVIECGTIPQHNGFDHFCEGCIDCAQYCIATCDEDSMCPNGGYCTGTGCIGAALHCGAYEYEGNDIACDDAFDNDDDGYLDCEDFDCSSQPTVTVCGPGENTDAACVDGIDNDDDGFLDCDDYDCSGNYLVTVCG